MDRAIHGSQPGLLESLTSKSEMEADCVHGEATMLRRRARARGFNVPRIERLEDRQMLAADPVIGANLDPIVEFGSAWTFKDAFLSSRPWISHAFNTVTGQETFGAGGEVLVDDHGWPTELTSSVNEQGQLIEQRISTLMFRDAGVYPGGTYRAEWKGTGTVKWEFDATVQSSGTLPDGTNFADLSVVPTNNGISMRIESIDTNDPIRDVRVWMPDYEGQSFNGQVWSPGETFSPFHPAFLDSLEPFSVLRFMEWTDTNRSSLAEWTDRREFDHARQRGEERGIAYEYIVELANSLQKDVWLNMPHLASDNFVTEYATLIRDSLDPNLKIYVEYSNEVWNGAFDAFHWITTQLPGGDTSKRWETTANEIVRDFDIWTSVFAGQEDRIVRVASANTNLPIITSNILGFMNGKFDAIEVGSYVRLTNQQLSTFDASTTVDDVLDEAFISLSQRTLPNIEAHQILAQQYTQQLGREIDLLVYEGGQLLLPESANSPYLNAIFDAQSDPRMYDLYVDLMRGLDHREVDLFNHFSHVNKLTPNSTTGALEYQTQPIAEAPKYQALSDAANGLVFEPGMTVTSNDVTEGVEDFAVLTYVLDDPAPGPFTFDLQLIDQSATGQGVDFGDAGAADIESSFDGGTTWTAGSSLLIPTNATSFLVRIPIIDDVEAESPESFLVVGSWTSQTITEQVTIYSDESLPFDIDTDLVAYWSFDDPQNPVDDSAVFGTVADNGTLIGNASVDVNGTLILDGTGDRLNVPSSVDINSALVPARTIALTFEPSDVLRRQILFEEGGITRGLNIYIENGQVVVGGWNRSAAQSNWQGTWLSAPIVSDQQYSVALVLDGGGSVSPDALIGYLNGIEFDRGEGSQLWTHSDPNGIGGPNREVRFGSEPETDKTNTHFLGAIDEVRVYNRALSAQDVSILAGVTPPDPVQITLSDSAATEGDDLVFEGLLSEPNSSAIVLDLSLNGVTASGADFGSLSAIGATLLGTELTIAPQTTAFQIILDTIDDAEPESAETLTLSAQVLSGPADPVASATGLINDNEPADTITGLVAHWTFDTPGPNVPDEAPFGSTLDVGSFVSDATVNANGELELDGTVDKVVVGNSADINTQIFQERTVSLFFTADDVMRRQVLFEEGAATRGLSIYVEDGDVVVGAWNRGVFESNWQGSWIHAPILPGQRYHVALVLDGDETIQPDALKAYLDGVQVGSLEGSQLWSHADPIGIGGVNGGARFESVPFTNPENTAFGGKLDDVRVYNRALTPVQVGSLSGGSNGSDPVTATISDAVVTEGGIASFTLTLASPLSEAATISLSLQDVEASSPDDYGSIQLAGPGTFDGSVLTIPAQTTSVALNVPTVDDGIAEESETFLLNATVLSGTILPISSATGTIADNDPSMTIANSPATEGADSHALFDFTISPTFDSQAQIAFSLSDQTANGLGVDYGTPAGIETEVSVDGGTTWVTASDVTLNAGDSSFLVRVPVIDDLEFESNETFRLTATSPNQVLFVDAVIISDDVPPFDLDTDLVAHYTFSTPGSVQALDSAPNDLISDDGVLNGGSQITNSEQLLLDGSSSYVAIPSSTEVNNLIVTERTVALAFNAENTTGRRQILFEEGGLTRGLVIYIENGEVIVGGWNRSALQSDWQGTWLSAPIVSDQWHHVSLTLSGSTTIQNDALIAYLDGVEFDRGPGSQLWNHNDPNGIGGANREVRFNSNPTTSGFNNYFEGLIDDVRIYNRVLSASEVNAVASLLPAQSPSQSSSTPLAASSFLDASPANVGPREDVNRDGQVSPFDALMIINHLSLSASHYESHLDIDGSGEITPFDALSVVNHLSNEVATPTQSGSLELDNEKTDETLEARDAAFAMPSLF